MSKFKTNELTISTHIEYFNDNGEVVRTTTTKSTFPRWEEEEMLTSFTSRILDIFNDCVKSRAFDMAKENISQKIYIRTIGLQKDKAITMESNRILN